MCASATGSSECPSAKEDLLDLVADLHAVLQRARRVERNALRPLVHRDERRDPAPLGRHDLDGVAGDVRDALRLVRVGRVARHEMPT